MGRHKVLGNPGTFIIGIKAFIGALFTYSLWFVSFVWFIWFIWFLWFKQPNKPERPDQPRDHIGSKNGAQSSTSLCGRVRGLVGQKKRRRSTRPKRDGRDWREKRDRRDMTAEGWKVGARNSEHFSLQPARLLNYTWRRRSVDSKLTCPVFVARDLSGSSSREFQRCTEIISPTMALGSTIGRALDRGVGILRRCASPSGSISRPSAS
jgi:hypothetical protein